MRLLGPPGGRVDAGELHRREPWRYRVRVRRAAPEGRDDEECGHHGAQHQDCSGTAH